MKIKKSNYQLICKLLMHKSHQCLIMVAKEDEIQMQSKTIPQKINELLSFKIIIEFYETIKFY